jgi:hypothetical protein
VECGAFIDGAADLSFVVPVVERGVTVKSPAAANGIEVA